MRRSLSLLPILLLLSACALLGSPQPDADTTPPILPASPTPPPAEPAIVPSPTALPPSLSPSPTAPPAPTPTPATPPLVFAVIGDYGQAGPELEAVAALVKSWNPELIITTGDNNYPSGSAKTIDQNIGQYFSDFIAPYYGEYGPGADVNRFFPSLGNHDWDAGKPPQPYLDYFTLPGNERYYDFVWGPVHFFALDSDTREPDGVARSSPQGQWLQEQLAASTAPWKIVYMHHAPYSSGTHGPTIWMQWPYQEWGADAVLAGHDHTYERIIRDGFPYFVNGLGGSPNRYIFANPQRGSEFRYRDGHGAMRVTATETQLTFEFITVDGQVLDTYTLTQPAPQADQPDPAGAPASVTTLPDPNAYTWQLIADGFDKPLLLTNAGDGSGRLFVVEQPGVIRIIGQQTPFLDIRERVGDRGNEQGLLGLAFHPNYAQNGYFYVNYTDNNGDTVVSRFTVRPDDPNQADPSTEFVLLRVPQPYANHNGGHLVFGPDGRLYIGLGDGGAADDPEGNAQNIQTLLGTILRIDVDAAQPYAIPPDNPFASDGILRELGGRLEIWLYGLRNPWRFSFDRLTGDLYIADVGQDMWEEINFYPAGQPGGANFGWDYFEASHPFEGTPPDGLALVAPIWEYNQDDGSCSVTGGYVYRGAQLPDWQGVYVFGDFCSGNVWGLVRDESGNWQHALLFQRNWLITSFGEDEAGELYLVARQGEIYRLVQK